MITENWIINCRAKIQKINLKWKSWWKQSLLGRKMYSKHWSTFSTGVRKISPATFMKFCSIIVHHFSKSFNTRMVAIVYCLLCAFYFCNLNNKLFIFFWNYLPKMSHVSVCNWRETISCVKVLACKIRKSDSKENFSG